MSMLLLDLVAKVRADVDEAQKKLTGLHKDLGDNIKDAALKGAGGIAGFIAGGAALNLVSEGAGFVKDAVGGMVTAALEANKGIAQTNAVIASTKGVSGMTAQSVGALADHLKDLDGVDDDVVRSAENMLLTFTNIHKDTFPQATQTALDMASALGEDATSASMQLGKALNDPLQGITALQRVGVTFTDKQKEMIAQAMKHGDVAKAQGIILKELGTEFGGSAKAAGDAAGPMNRLQLAWGDMQKLIGNALLPILNQLATSLAPLIQQFGDWLPGALKSAQVTVAPLIDGLSHMGPVMQKLGDVMAFLAANGETVKSVLLAFAIGVGVVLVPAFIAWTVAAGAAAIATIAATWPILAVIAVIALLVLGIKLLVEHWSQISAWLQGVWNATVAGVQAGIQGLGDWFSRLGTMTHDGLMAAIAAIVNFTLNLINRFLDAKAKVDNTIANLISGVVNWFAQLPGRVFSWVANLVGGVVNWFVTMELRGLAIIAGFISGLIGTLMGSIGKIVGWAGYIKDGILGALGDLGGRLAQLARDAIGNMISAIRGMAGAVGNAVSGLLGGLHLPHFAAGGTMAASGFAMVGEEGPELVALPAGATVYPHGSMPSAAGTPRPLASATGSTSNQPIQLLIDDAGLRVIAEAILPHQVRELRRLGVNL